MCIGQCCGITGELLGVPQDPPLDDSLRYVSTAPWSSPLDFGENEGWVPVQIVLDIDPGESENISVLLAFECTQADPHRFRVNELAPRNMRYMLFTLDTSHFEMSPLNKLAPWNIPDMSCTLDTSHFEMSPLNAFA